MQVVVGIATVLPYLHLASFTLQRVAGQVLEYYGEVIAGTTTYLAQCSIPILYM